MMTILLLWVSHSAAFVLGFVVCGLLCRNKEEENND